MNVGGTAMDDDEGIEAARSRNSRKCRELSYFLILLQRKVHFIRNAKNRNIQMCVWGRAGGHAHVKGVW